MLTCKMTLPDSPHPYAAYDSLCAQAVNGRIEQSQAPFSPLSTLSEKSQRDLPRSKRENGWWVASRSRPTDMQKVAVSSLAVAVTIASSHFAYCLREGWPGWVSLGGLVRPK